MVSTSPPPQPKVIFILMWFELLDMNVKFMCWNLKKFMNLIMLRRRLRTMRRVFASERPSGGTRRFTPWRPWSAPEFSASPTPWLTWAGTIYSNYQWSTYIYYQLLLWIFIVYGLTFIRNYVEQNFNYVIGAKLFERWNLLENIFEKIFERWDSVKKLE